MITVTATKLRNNLFEKACRTSELSLLENQIIPLESVVEHYIRQALLKTSGKIGGKQGAAELLDINPSTLRR